MLEISELQVSYGPTRALFDVSLSVAKGEMVSLLGRNGMGKSTTVKAVLGLVAVNSGIIRFRNESVSKLPSFQIASRGIGLVPEGRRIISSLTVEENILAFARKRPKSANQWTLDRIYLMFPRLKERKRSLGGTLSGGEQQMLAIGRALATNPELVILDEATEGLAPLVREEIWNVLRQLKSQGLSLLVIDKNVDALLSVADRHFIVEKGRTVWSGDSATYRSQSTQLQRFLTV